MQNFITFMVILNAAMLFVVIMILQVIGRDLDRIQNLLIRIHEPDDIRGE